MIDHSSGTDADDRYLVEVWNDTVDSRHVVGAVLISIGLAVPTFLVAQQLFTASMAETELAKTYAMLAGIGACLVAALISARFFPPKRVVTERQVDREDQIATVMEIARQPQGIGEVSALSESEKSEMRDLGLLDIFEEAERRLREERSADGVAPDSESGARRA